MNTILYLALGLIIGQALQWRAWLAWWNARNAPPPPPPVRSIVTTAPGFKILEP